MDIKQSEKKALIAFGKRIRSIRERLNITLEEMEERGWPSWRHLQKIERGKNINLITLLRLAKALEVGPEDLIKDL